MSIVFFPSCKARTDYPAASDGLAKYMKTRFDVEQIGCCRVNHQNLTGEDKAVLVKLAHRRYVENGSRFPYGYADVRG